MKEEGKDFGRAVPLKRRAAFIKVCSLIAFVKDIELSVCNLSFLIASLLNLIFFFGGSTKSTKNQD